jgi:hypothetical protein
VDSCRASAGDTAGCDTVSVLGGLWCRCRNGGDFSIQKPFIICGLGGAAGWGLAQPINEPTEAANTADRSLFLVSNMTHGSCRGALRASGRDTRALRETPARAPEDYGGVPTLKEPSAVLCCAAPIGEQFISQSLRTRRLLVTKQHRHEGTTGIQACPYSGANAFRLM